MIKSFEDICVLWREQEHWQTMGQVCDLFFGYPYELNKYALGACYDIIQGRNLPHINDFHFILQALSSRISESDPEKADSVQVTFATDNFYKTKDKNPYLYLTRTKIDQLKIISHRGNIDGPNKSEENRPDIIKKRLEEGYQVEVDVWLVNEEFYFGHDAPEYRLKNYLDLEQIEPLLLHPDIWLHAKNLGALHSLKNAGAHCFWHEKDRFTLTSKGHIWTYPGEGETSVSSVLMLADESSELINIKELTCGAICTDYVTRYKKVL
jgi:hypothetical protein